MGVCKWPRFLPILVELGIISGPRLLTPRDLTIIRAPFSDSVDGHFRLTALGLSLLLLGNSVLALKKGLSLCLFYETRLGMPWALILLVLSHQSAARTGAAVPVLAFAGPEVIATSV